ncbi:hypothetical protein R1flu_011145 [Riccia fluitans]|uniref:Serine/threonine-protein kinase ATR n=1 Tax=Riccia fluitans TaxID=41844 RepID=A0ABD1Z701_9MARC
MKEGMTDLFVLLQDLGERIASKADAPIGTQHEEDDPVEARFRSVLPTLLDSYFVPFKVKERELMAISKLLCHTVKQYPGVLYKGKGEAVLPVLSRIFPLFAEPELRGCHGGLFDTAAALLSLLRTGDPETFRSVVMDSMLLVEDLASVGLFYGSLSSCSPVTNVSLHCYSKTYSDLSSLSSSGTAPQFLCGIAVTWRPQEGPGLLIDVTGQSRLQLLSNWSIKLLGCCLVEGALLVEGLITSSFLSALGLFFCHESPLLHKECFDFIRVATSVTDMEALPTEKLILSIINILSLSSGEFSGFRTSAYDSALGACLYSLCSTCQIPTLESIAQAFVEILPRTVKQTGSKGLKVAMCDIFLLIVKQCPYFEYLAAALELIWMPEVITPVSESLQAAVEAIGLEEIAGSSSTEKPTTPITREGLHVGDVDCETATPSQTQQSQEYQSRPVKRQKLGQKTEKEFFSRIFTGVGVAQGKSVSSFPSLSFPSCKEQAIPSTEIHKRILQLIDELRPFDTCATEAVTAECKLSGLFILGRVFGKCIGTLCHRRLVELLHQWLLWVTNKAEDASLSSLQLSMYLEAVEKFLLEEELGNCDGNVFGTFKQTFLESKENRSVFLEALLLPWLLLPRAEEENVLVKLKCRVVSIVSAIAAHPEAIVFESVITRALKDDDARVRAAGVAAVPNLVAYTTQEIISRFSLLLSSAGSDEAERVREMVGAAVGVMSCVNDAVCSRWELSKGGLSTVGNTFGRKVSCGTARFVCPICDAERRPMDNNTAHRSPETQSRTGSSPLVQWQPLFALLLFEEKSEHVQMAFIGSISRMLQHSTAQDISVTRMEWLQCLDMLPLHRRRSVREAFGSQIKYFTKTHVLAGLFGHQGEDGDRNGELQMLGKLKYALCTAEELSVKETLLETIAEVAKASQHCRQLHFYSLVLLLEQLDNSDLSLRAQCVKLIHGVDSSSLRTPGAHKLQKTMDLIREELFEYLTSRLISRPVMVQEFAEAVLEIECANLVKQMVPVMLPKLVLDQQHSQDASDALHELAKQLNTDLPLLLLEWCHKVLSVLLLRADGKELMAALQFYEAQTGSDPREIFAAVLPALLDELVRFLGDTDTEEGLRRSARVAPMIQEVASIVTGSDDLPSFLRSHFVGLLNSIDRKLLRSEDVTSQKQALRCIERLVDMIGPHLSAFVPKIMALLTRALQEPTVQLEGLKVWLSFVRTLAHVAPANVKGVASQIVVALMPCLEGQQDEQNAAAVVLEELIVRNRAALEDQARELPLLPSLPPLTNVNTVLHEARGSLSLRDQLRRAADGLTHESLSVRYTTASELNKVMRAQRREITAMLVAEVSMDVAVISSLVTALLRGCAEESRRAMSQRLKLACAECLGELGAVDPVKLQVDLRQQSRIERNNEDLVFELIKEHLAKVLRAATDTDIQDAAALAIQELLKLSGCQAALVEKAQKPAGKGKDAQTRASKNSGKIGQEGRDIAASGEQLWRRFSDDVKEIITPCLTSKYLLKRSGASVPAGPIFRSGMSFRRWMYLWIRRLISQTTGDRAQIFIACIGVVRHDMGTALYLLPYLVLNVVCEGSCEARTSVTEEILAVLAETAFVNHGSLVLERGLGSMSRSWSGPSEVSTQTIFTLIDCLGQWLDDCKLLTPGQTTSKGNSSSSSTGSGQDSGPLALHRDNVLQLLAAIPKRALAGASFRCQAYARALLYFESYVREKSGSLNPAAVSSGAFEDDDVTFLLDIYSGLDEPDGLSGLSRLRTTTTLQDQILIHEKSGNWGESLTCYEQALQMEPTSVLRHSGLLNCLLNMGHLQAMVTHVDGLNLRIPDHKRDWSMRGIQASWRLGQWNLLEEYVTVADSDGSLLNGGEGYAVFDLSLAKILQAHKKGDRELFTEQIMMSRQSLLAPLAAASMESYTRAYPLIVKLHMLQELEDFSSLADTKAAADSNHLKVIMELVGDWENRLRITQPSLWAREPILALRRLLFGASGLQSEVGICWLEYAKLCRAAAHFETANRAILQAQAVGAPNSHMEMAKLLWDTSKKHRAITELQQALSGVSRTMLGNAYNAALGGLVCVHGQSPARSAVKVGQDRSPGLSKMSTQARKDEDLVTAKALLLLARWVHHTGQKQKDDVVSLYARVKELQPKWEKGYFFMAKYFDDLLVDARKRQEELQDGRSDPVVQRRHITVDDKHWWTYLPEVILFYAKGLHKGHRHLFQAMPRLLTLWFEFGSTYAGDSLSSNKTIKTVHGRVMGIMRGCLKDLPPYQWLTSLPQLVSRICHQNEEVVRLVKQIITIVLQAYPQQSLWIMAAVSKSTVPARREAAAEIIQLARSSLGQEREKTVLFSQFAGLIDQMIRLCMYSGQPKAKTVSLSTEFGYLKRMMPVGVIMPLQRALTVTLPPRGLTDINYNPFPPAEFSTIAGIGDEIEILASLQRPKKVVLLGSDGLEHPFLCKPKDDLRKDARMMEFTTMINRLLQKDPKSRRRKLYIRTFAVIPLTEDCGMIEWVLHTRGLRHILQDIYVACGKFDRQKTNPAIKRIYDQHQAQKGSDKVSDAEMFRSKILPMFPPVFHRWFLNTFPEPAAWFQARVAYAHTTAVWSMVGHMVGLGDRHGENILFDATTGDCVHVDFSCLFDKGLQLEKPELVPFRLTQNLVDGLGITGYEGIFLRVSEITLSVLRSHRETLMSVLETFLHDPLVEWTKSHKSSGVEVQNPHAQRAIANIEARFEGVVVGVGAAPSLPHSVEGQAHRLIEEAVSHQNLRRYNHVRNKFRGKFQFLVTGVLVRTETGGRVCPQMNVERVKRGGKVS